jgi:hypothetical protein
MKSISAWVLLVSLSFALLAFLVNGEDEDFMNDMDKG